MAPIPISRPPPTVAWEETALDSDEGLLKRCLSLRRRAARMREISAQQIREARELNDIAADLDETADALGCPDLDDLENGA